MGVLLNELGHIAHIIAIVSVFVIAIFCIIKDPDTTLITACITAIVALGLGRPPASSTNGNGNSQKTV